MLKKWMLLPGLLLVVSAQIADSQIPGVNKSKSPKNSAPKYPAKIAPKTTAPVVPSKVLPTTSPTAIALPTPTAVVVPSPSPTPLATLTPEVTPLAVPASTPIPAAAGAKTDAEAVPPPPREGLLGAFRLGPMFSSSIPAPIEFGIESKYENSFGGSLSYGDFTYSGKDTDKVKDLKARFSHFALQGNWYPGASSFFLGASLGRRTIAVSATSNTKLKTGGTESPVNIDAKFVIQSYFIGWHLGWLKEWDSGFALGTGIGFFTPFKSTTSFEADYKDNATVNDAIKQTDAYRGLEEDVSDAGKKAGLLALPQIQIIRIAYLF